ncbi:hypothetical protein H696_05250 [Fonticula alba]|uniref:Uncharacterized protein n=1 Tax=Fonticula alba TaxID=691883 RepID=A0A058Z324_FONAL|nr:hypothetical protein H696_05250 [Fonticula alba]KCV68333.1 hypothetical protein H696_05250 [Fonticula alba]|eukprot:XP_009497387.1 hypothetical protein H696_05250 [Fonticula alba]
MSDPTKAPQSGLSKRILGMKFMNRKSGGLAQASPNHSQPLVPSSSSTAVSSSGITRKTPLVVDQAAIATPASAAAAAAAASSKGTKGSAAAAAPATPVLASTGALLALTNRATAASAHLDKYAAASVTAFEVDESFWSLDSLGCLDRVDRQRATSGLQASQAQVGKPPLAEDPLGHVQYAQSVYCFFHQTHAGRRGPLLSTRAAQAAAAAAAKDEDSRESLDDMNLDEETAPTSFTSGNNKRKHPQSGAPSKNARIRSFR